MCFQDKLRQVLAGENTSDGFNLFVNLMISKRIALDRLTAEVMAEIANSESGTNATNGQGEAGKSNLAESKNLYFSSNLFCPPLHTHTP